MPFLPSSPLFRRRFRGLLSLSPSDGASEHLPIFLCVGNFNHVTYLHLSQRAFGVGIGDQVGYFIFCLDGQRTRLAVHCGYLTCDEGGLRLLGFHLRLFLHCRRRWSRWRGWGCRFSLGEADAAEGYGNQCKDKNSKRVLHSITSFPALDASILQCFKPKTEKKIQGEMKKRFRLLTNCSRCGKNASQHRRIKDCKTGGHCLPGAFFEQHPGYLRGPSDTAQFLRSGPRADNRTSI